MMIETLATGRWLTRQRLIALPALSLAATIGVIGWLFATAQGTRDFAGRPLGTDFSNVWSAGIMTWQDKAALAWNWPAQAAVQQAVHHDPAIPFYGWHYPPPFLLVAALLAMLPYAPALIVWQAATLAAVLRLVTRIVPDPRALLLAAGAPVVLVCLGHGHNGFLTAALLGGGMLLIDRRPFAAGLLLGCLIYKPQFAALLPVVLLASRRPAAVAGALCSGGALVALTLLLWGWPVWAAFLESLPLTQQVVIEQGSTGWFKIQTAFSAVRAVGGSVALGYSVQALVTGTALLAALAAMLRASPNVRNAIVMIAALLSTPYALDYDYTLAGLGIAFLAADGLARGFLRWERTGYALAWITPLFARAVAEATLVPIGLIGLLVLFALALRRMTLLDRPFARGYGIAIPPLTCSV